jgi:hypothetical protein
LLAMGLSYVVFIMLRYDPSISTFFRSFIIDGSKFCQMLFMYVLRWLCDFYDSIYLLYYVYLFVYIESFLSLGWNQFDHKVIVLMCVEFNLQVLLLRISTSSMFNKNIDI